MINGGDEKRIMEAKIKIIIDEERAMKRINAATDKMKRWRNLKILSRVSFIPILLLSLVQIYVYRYDFGMLLKWGVIGLVAGGSLWFCRLGSRRLFMFQLKKQLAAMQYPVEQILSFDEDEVEVNSEKSMKKTRWDSIEMVCEDEDYWFLEYSGIIIDKDVLTPEQYRFIRGKCDAVKERPKYID